MSKCINVKEVSSDMSLAIPCAVCGKIVPLNPIEARYTTFRLCDECIKAIKWARIQMKTPHIVNITEDDGK